MPAPSADRRGVVVVVNSLANGGAERQMTMLCSKLDGEWAPSVVSLTDGPYRQVLEAAGIPVTVFPRSLVWDVRPAWKVWRFVRESRPKVIHAWGWMSVLSSWLPGALDGVPLVNGSIRGGHVPKRRARIARLTYRMGELVIANSTAGLVAFDIPVDRGRVVHNGFDMSRIASATRTRAPQADGVCVVVMAARMSKAKDFDLLIRCARELQTAEPGAWRFVAVGDGPELERVRAAAQDLVQAGVMELPGGTLDVINRVIDADIGVLFTDPAHHAEGISNSVMEYMACGLPVVASETGGTSELVLDGETGYVVPPGDMEAAVGALRALRGDVSQAAGMGEAGRERIASEFSVDRMVERTIDVYREAIERKSGG